MESLIKPRLFLFPYQHKTPCEECIFVSGVDPHVNTSGPHYKCQQVVQFRAKKRIARGRARGELPVQIR